MNDVTLVRTQIQLTSAQIKTLKAMAAAKGVSMAALIRSAVDDLTTRRSGSTATDQRRRALAVVGRFSSGSTDGSEHHDDYVAEAFRR